jgi:hypothetical protein
MVSELERERVLAMTFEERVEAYGIVLFNDILTDESE